MSETDLSRLPQIERLLCNPRLEPWIGRLSRPLVARLASETVASFRESLRARRAGPPPAIGADAGGGRAGGSWRAPAGAPGAGA